MYNKIVKQWVNNKLRVILNHITFSKNLSLVLGVTPSSLIKLPLKKF